MNPVKPVPPPLDVIGAVSNGAAAIIALSEPYSTKVTIEGVSAILFHRWSVDAVAEKAKAAKGSKGKKQDDVESYVWRMEDGNPKSHLALPGEYFRQSIIQAARFMQDPRSPRKSAKDLYEAGIIVETELADLGSARWDKLDRRRVQIQRNGITRERPCLQKGWRATFELVVILPEYISRENLGHAMMNAGRLIGVADHRPTFGRFMVTEFK